MNPELQKELTAWLQSLRTVVESGAAFAKDQIPQVLWEKVMVDRVFYTVASLLCVAVIATLFAYFRNRVIRSNGNGPDSELAIGALVAHGITAILSMIMFLTGFYDLCLVWFAPRLYLINWIKELVTPVSR